MLFLFLLKNKSNYHVEHICLVVEQSWTKKTCLDTPQTLRVTAAKSKFEKNRRKKTTTGSKLYMKSPPEKRKTFYKGWKLKQNNKQLKPTIEKTKQKADLDLMTFKLVVYAPR
jgi:hypothetical protein